MITTDDILLAEAYSKVIKENENTSSIDSKWYFDKNGQPPYNVEYSNRTFNVRGKDVLIKREWDNMEDDEWYYLSLVDPETKERVFNDIGEKEIKQSFFK